MEVSSHGSEKIESTEGRKNIESIEGKEGSGCTTPGQHGEG
jgi:hypothetical protein